MTLHSPTRRRLASVSIALTGALLLSACGGGGDGGSDATGGSGGSGGSGGTGGTGGEPSTSGSPSAAAGVPTETGFVGVAETDAQPQEGGTLTVAVWGEARGLAPASSSSFGVLGGMENAAIYDVLVRYDPTTGEYEPWMATSLEHSEDFATWTLGLREGVEFSDGTPLNAAAVMANFERAKGGRYDALVAEVESIQTPDDLTVVFHLKEPWSRFPFLLSIGPGRVASPTAADKWGKELGSHPVGAGPFVLDHFAKGEEMVLTANENYWGEGPHLDKLRFVPLGGDQARLDSLEAGGVQAAFVRDPGVIAAARKAGYGGFVGVINAGEVLWLNNAEGHPPADPRIRKAIASAIDIDQFNERAFDGQGLAQKEIVAESSTWATETKATPYDPEKAKELVAAAKADGFDGTLTFSSNTAPTRQAEALALQAQLNAVGFDVTIDQNPSVVAQFTQVVKGDYDIGFGGLSFGDAAPWAKLAFALTTGGATNYAHYANPEMDALINELHDATTEEGKQQALNEIQELWTETVPLVSLAAIPNFIAMTDNLHGVTPTAYSTLIFGQAWLGD